MSPSTAPRPPRRPSLPRHLRAPLADALTEARLDRARWLGEGWGAIAYRIPAPDGDWTLRVPREGVPWAIEDLEREVRLLPVLAGRPFDVAVPRDPRLLTVDERTVGALHRFVPGEPVGDRTLRGAARREFLAAVGRFLAVLHATPVHEAVRHGVESRDLWRDVALPRIEETMALAGPRTREWLRGRVEAMEGLLRQPAPSVLIHGDISGDHLLAGEDGRLAGVIDFAEARLSDPALDLAGVLNRFGWRDLEVVLRHYDAPVDGACLDRARIDIEIAPIYSVTDGYVALGDAERRRGLRRLAARSAR